MLTIKLRNKIRKRDNFTCQKCNAYIDDNGDVHHKKATTYGGNNNENNLVYLCHACHKITTNHCPNWELFSNKEFLTPFQSYMKVFMKKKNINFNCLNEFYYLYTKTEYEFKQLKLKQQYEKTTNHTTPVSSPNRVSI